MQNTNSINRNPKLVNNALQLLGQLSHNTALLEELAELVIKRIN